MGMKWCAIFVSFTGSIIFMQKNLCLPGVGSWIPRWWEGQESPWNGTTPSLLVASSALMLEELGRERRQLPDSGWWELSFWSPWEVQPPHSCSLKIHRIPLGPERSSLGSRLAYTLTPPPREGTGSGPWVTLSSWDPGLALIPIYLTDCGVPSEPDYF